LGRTLLAHAQHSILSALGDNGDLGERRARHGSTLVAPCSFTMI